jgi:hypothetical protein
VQEILARLDEIEPSADDPVPLEEAWRGVAEYLELENELAALTRIPVEARHRFIDTRAGR